MKIGNGKQSNESIAEGVAAPLVKFQVKLKSSVIDIKSITNNNIEKKFSEINEEIAKSINKKIILPYNQQNDAFKQQINEQQIIVAQSRKSYSGCRYNIFNVADNYQKLVDLITQTDPEYRTFNEVITPNQKVKLGFDLEWMDQPNELVDPGNKTNLPRHQANYYDKEFTLNLKNCV